MEDLFGIALRISITYLYLLALMRLAGKRSLDSLSPLDFVIALVIGDLLDDIIWAEVPLSQGVVAISTVLLLHSLLAYLEYRSDPVHRLVASSKTLMIQMGKWVEAGMSKERVREEEILFELRILKEDNLKEVREAYLEPKGMLSVLKVEQAKEAQKVDLPALKEMMR